MKYTNTILLLLFIIVFYSCEKEIKLEDRNYPILFTKEVADINAEGVTFEGQILNPKNFSIDDFGFIWTDDTENFKYSLKGKASPDNFSLRVSSDLNSNKSYACNAYIDTPDKLIYGNKVLFESKGSLAPSIYEFYPKEGFSGTEVTVVGSNFSLNHYHNIVTFNGENVYVKYSSKDSLQFFIPDDSFIGNADLVLKVGANTVNFDSKFKIIGPTITGISETSLFSGDVITINGENFTSNASYVQLFFGQVEAEILSLKETEIKAIVPIPWTQNWVDDYSCKLKLYNGNKVTEYSSDYIIKTPWSENSPLDFSVINSRIFTYNNKSYIHEQWRPIVHTYTSETDTWSQETSEEYPNTTKGSLQIILSGKMHLVGGSSFNKDPYQELWVYDINNKTWSRNADLPFNFLKAIYFERNNGIHILTDKGEHWKCDFENEEYSRLNNIPINFEWSFAFSFVSENKVFAGTYGQTLLYNETDDIWVDNGPFPLSKGYYTYPNTQCFTYKNSGYIYDTKNNLLWRYDVAIQRWIKTAKVPFSLINHPEISIFELNNTIYFEDVNQSNQHMYSFQKE